MVVPPGLPECLAVTAASLLRSTAEAADVDVTWLERPLDAEFSLIRQRLANVGLGWLTTRPRGPAASRWTPSAWASSNPRCGSRARTWRHAAGL